MKGFLTKVFCFVCYAFKALTVLSSIIFFVQKYTGLVQANVNFIILVILVLINLSFAAKKLFSLRAELLFMASRHQLSFGECFWFFVETYM